MRELKLVKVSAPDSFGRGEEYGAQARDEILRCIETYKEHLYLHAHLRWQDAMQDAGRYLPLVIAALPDETNMLRGVASGAGVDFGEIMVLNTRYEMLHYPKKECTTFAVLREAARNGKVFVGQNWDQRPVVIPHVILLHVTLEDGTRIMGLTEAGQLLRNGMNSNGLGLAASSLNSSLDCGRIGIPGNFLRMRALRSRSLEEMREVLTAFQRSVANNYCIASRTDKAADIEGIPDLPCVMYPENGIITHANHILSRPEIDTSRGKKFRGERLGELLRLRVGDITLEYIKKCLSDHEGYPDSICSHQDEEAADKHRQWMTVASIIYNLDDLELDVCVCNPCEGEYKKFRLMDY
jgi:isopenicillin-N N-acyltransferase-like protein